MKKQELSSGVTKTSPEALRSPSQCSECVKTGEIFEKAVREAQEALPEGDKDHYVGPMVFMALRALYLFHDKDMDRFAAHVDAIMFRVAGEEMFAKLQQQALAAMPVDPKKVA